MLVRAHFESSQPGASLEFEAESSDSSVARVHALQRGAVLVTPVGTGEARVTVLARGAEDGEASGSFSVTVLPSCPQVVEGAYDRFPAGTDSVWVFEANERTALREDWTRYRGEWTVTFGQMRCTEGRRTTTVRASFEGERGRPHTDLGTWWTPFTYQKLLDFEEAEGMVTFEPPSMVSGAVATFARFGPEQEVEIQTAEEGRQPCTDPAIFSDTVGLAHRSFSCYYGMGWSEESTIQRH